MQPSLWQLLIVAALVLILFGRGRISEMMGDVGKGIKSFKQGITDDDNASAKTKPAQLESNNSVGTATEKETRKSAD